MRNSRNLNFANFESELQFKLTQIDNRRSHQKLPTPAKPRDIEIDELDGCSGIDRTKDGYNTHQSHNLKMGLCKKEAMPQSYPSLPENNTFQALNNQQSNDREFDEYSIFQIVKNAQLEQFLKQHYGSKTEKIYLDDFLGKILSSYFGKEHELTAQLIRQIYVQLKQEITTTDPEIVSLNALEISLNKHSCSLRNYIYEKILTTKHQIEHKKLNQQYYFKLNQLQTHKEQLVIAQKNLHSRSKQLSQKEVEIAKRMKSLQLKQKQIITKQKHYRKILEEKGEKMMNEGLSQISNANQKLEKRINSFERNIKYKIEHLEKRVHEIHRLREFKEEEIRKNVNQQLKMEQSRHQKLASSAHVKKLEKERKELNEELLKIKRVKEQADEESHKLMKVCTNYENKIAKLERKLKTGKVEWEAKEQKIAELFSIIHEKEFENEELMKKLAETQMNRNEHYANIKGHKSSYKDDATSKTLKDVVVVYEQFLMLSRTHSDSSVISPIMLSTSIEVTDKLLLEHIVCQQLVIQQLMSISQLICAEKDKQNRVILQEFDGVPQTLKSLSESVINKPLFYSMLSNKKFLKFLKSKIELLCYHLIVKTLLPLPRSQEQSNSFSQLLKLLNSELQQKSEEELESIHSQFYQILNVTNFMVPLIEKLKLCHAYMSQRPWMESVGSAVEFLLGIGLVTNANTVKYLTDWGTHQTLFHIFMCVIEQTMKANEYSRNAEILEQLSIVIQRIVYFSGNVIDQLHEAAAIQSIKVLMIRYQELTGSSNSMLMMNVNGIFDAYGIE